MEALSSLWGAAHGWVFQACVAPLAYRFGWTAYLDQAYDATELFLVGVVEVAVIALAFTGLERWRPVEVRQDRAAVRTDVLYTLLHRLGIAPLVFFVVLAPFVDAVDGWLRLHDLLPAQLEEGLPGLATHPLASFVAYLVVLDLVRYWIHRGQHASAAWWALHSLHHSQRSMTVWTDDRNHLLDDLLVDAIVSAVALAIGLPPGQFVILVAATRMLESLSHANARISFGRWGEMLLVSPRFHRLHHALDVEHSGSGGGRNFATLLPIWDRLFGTVDRRSGFPATGISDQLTGRDYGRGFLRQQWLGVRRMFESP